MVRDDHIEVQDVILLILLLDSENCNEIQSHLLAISMLKLNEIKNGIG